MRINKMIIANEDVCTYIKHVRTRLKFACTWFVGYFTIAVALGAGVEQPAYFLGRKIMRPSRYIYLHKYSI